MLLLVPSLDLLLLLLLFGFFVVFLLSFDFDLLSLALLLILSFIALFLVIIISSMVGVADITFVDGAKIILNRIILLDRLISLDGIKHNYITIVWDIRFPRILLSALIGCGLSVSGAAFQGMFKNPMADPYVLGVSSGAALGATIGIVLGFQSSLLGLGSITIMAFIGAITTMIVVYHIAKIGGKVPVITLLLAGISISYLLSSVISIMMIFNKSQLDKIVFWIMGSVSAASWTHVKMLAPITLIVTFFVIFFAKDLNIMLMGEDTASSLGIEVERVKKNSSFTLLYCCCSNCISRWDYWFCRTYCSPYCKDGSGTRL